MSTTTLPWYRYFWPWFVIALLAAAVLGSSISLYFALQTSDIVLEHADAAQ